MPPVPYICYRSGTSSEICGYDQDPDKALQYQKNKRIKDGFDFVGIRDEGWAKERIKGAL